MLIIGLHGKKRSGKDTAAKALIGAGWRHFAFADALRDGLLALDPLVDRGVYLSDVIAEYGWEGVKDSPYAEEVRRLLQRFGTEVGRDTFGENVWADKVAEKIADLEGTDVPGAVITDVRFDNEGELINALGGTVVKVVRPGQANVDGHKSERPVSDHLIDMVVLNDGTIEDLHRRILHVAHPPTQAAAA